MFYEVLINIVSPSYREMQLSKGGSCGMVWVPAIYSIRQRLWYQRTACVQRNILPDC